MFKFKIASQSFLDLIVPSTDVLSRILKEIRAD